MATGGGQADGPEYREHVDRFLQRHDLETHRTRLFVSYGSWHTYTEVVRVDETNRDQEIQADALFTTLKNTTLTLPVADCVATVVYDPVTQMVGLLHLGRHASVAGLIESFVIEVADTLGSDPRDWYVWMSPSIRKEHDRMEYFDPSNSDEWREFVDTRPGGIHIDVIGHNRARFIRAAVNPARITVSTHDTYDSPNFYSHRAAAQKDDDVKRGRMIAAVRVISRL